LTKTTLWSAEKGTTYTSLERQKLIFMITNAMFPADSKRRGNIEEEIQLSGVVYREYNTF
jgi:hypothetical protein